MPKIRRQLSQDQLEVDEILSSSQGSSRHIAEGLGNELRTGTPTSAQVHHPPESKGIVTQTSSQPVKRNVLSLGALGSLIQDLVFFWDQEWFFHVSAAKGS